MFILYYCGEMKNTFCREKLMFRGTLEYLFRSRVKYYHYIVSAFYVFK